MHKQEKRQKAKLRQLPAPYVMFGDFLLAIINCRRPTPFSEFWNVTIFMMNICCKSLWIYFTAKFLNWIRPIPLDENYYKPELSVKQKKNNRIRIEVAVI